jgi:hypothetical protein
METGIGDMLDALAEELTRDAGTGRRGDGRSQETGAVAQSRGRYRRRDALRSRARDQSRDSSAVLTSGKSSLLNRLLGEERAIVSPVAGHNARQRRYLLKTDDQTFRIIDTAGIRRKGKTTQMAEKLSVIMARKSLDRADVAIVLLDAERGRDGIGLDDCGLCSRIRLFDHSRAEQMGLASRQRFERGRALRTEASRSDEVSQLGAGGHDFSAHGPTGAEASAGGDTRTPAPESPHSDVTAERIL